MSQRTLAFRDRPENRYWWHRWRDHDYVPPIFQSLSPVEWLIMDAWFQDTNERSLIGEMSVPGLSLLSGLVSGSGMNAIVQCGHYVGYSTLMLGFLLRSMNKEHALFSVDIDKPCTEYTQSWVDRAGLQNQVLLTVSDSADPVLPEKAKDYLGRAPQLVFIDSSHKYDHTLRELDLWWEALAPGGILAMHDVSEFARNYDSTGRGGVKDAVLTWAKRKNLHPFLLNSFTTTEALDVLPYKDGCGLGLLQKPIRIS